MPYNAYVWLDFALFKEYNSLGERRGCSMNQKKHSIDMTQFVNYCIDAGITTPTVAVRLNPLSATNPAMRFMFFTNSRTKSAVTYYKNAVK